MPQPAIEPETFWFLQQCSNPMNHPARAPLKICDPPNLDKKRVLFSATKCVIICYSRKRRDSVCKLPRLLVALRSMKVTSVAEARGGQKPDHTGRHSPLAVHRKSP